MVALLVTYMEMTALPAGKALAITQTGTQIARERVAADDYLSAYRDIGAAVQWDSRLRVPQTDVAAWLAADTSDVYLLRMNGEIAGMCEFDAANALQVELVHFGLVPAAQGKGLGRILLDHALRDFWSRRNPRRIWLHTDTNDHPNAVVVYTKAGFQPYLTRMEEFDD